MDSQPRHSRHALTYQKASSATSFPDQVAVVTTSQPTAWRRNSLAGLRPEVSSVRGHANKVFTPSPARATGFTLGHSSRPPPMRAPQRASSAKRSHSAPTRSATPTKLFLFRDSQIFPVSVVYADGITSGSDWESDQIAKVAVTQFSLRKDSLVSFRDVSRGRCIRCELYPWTIANRYTFLRFGCRLPCRLKILVSVAAMLAEVEEGSEIWPNDVSLEEVAELNEATMADKGIQVFRTDSPPSGGLAPEQNRPNNTMTPNKADDSAPSAVKADAASGAPEGTAKQSTPEHTSVFLTAESEQISTERVLPQELSANSPSKAQGFAVDAEEYHGDGEETGDVVAANGAVGHVTGTGQPGFSAEPMVVVCDEVEDLEECTPAAANGVSEEEPPVSIEGGSGGKGSDDSTVRSDRVEEMKAAVDGTAAGANAPSGGTAAPTLPVVVELLPDAATGVPVPGRITTMHGGDEVQLTAEQRAMIVRLVEDACGSRARESLDSARSSGRAGARPTRLIIRQTRRRRVAGREGQAASVTGVREVTRAGGTVEGRVGKRARLEKKGIFGSIVDAVWSFFKPASTS
ncbi:hypothetical protein DFJ73DRAFT_827582 [Zopfochytrium polystomum]|nr:hypothetical protein DFJ73DRAFT_827582 [Zopfochytrium polystomum]